MNLPLIVDSFAGGGGASTGIEMALGRSPDIAINHNAAALALHEANHPQTLHLSENVYKIDPLDYLRGAHVGLGWFSPDCKHFSKAKGGKPVERNIRDLAWIIPGWIERIQRSGGKVDVVILENVEEFQDYGPLMETARGLQPDPERKGEYFKKWCRKIRSLGGKIEWRELRACDYGAPTIRKRFFAVIRFDGQPIVWPKPTHGAPTDPDVISGHKLPWRTAAEIIDWSLPCPSIFDTSEQIMEKHGLRSVRPLADNTMARVARGMKRYVLDAERPFLVNLTHGGRVEAVDEPFKTITGAHRGEKAVVSPHLASVAHGDSGGRREYPLTEPHGVVTAGGISNALIAPSVIRFNTGATGQDAREPLSTVTANSFIKRPGGAAPLGVVAPHLMTMRNAGKPFNGADEPTHTITAGGAGLTVVAPVLTAAQHGGSTRSIDSPSHTITASTKDQNSVIAPTLVQVGYGERSGQAPRALDIDRPLGTVVAGCTKHALATALIARDFGTSTGHSLDEPTHTVMPDGQGKSRLITAYMAQHNNDSRREGGVNPGRSMDEPVSTVTQTGSQQSVVAPYLQAYYGTGDGGEENQPVRTVTTKDRHGHVEATLDVPPFTPAQADRAREVAAFLRAYGFWDEREFVTIEAGGVVYVIVDIGMRMLVPRELYLAQGFPADYEIERGVNGELFSKSVQVSCCGNSVSPPVAAALVAANCSHLAVRMEAAE
ncbi:DNA cytosine methyltransferase [Brucella anthropi]|uniref:DNA cytosine methyltransferase n=1 Tax=Brucella anthropi TaxID=529 RepID=UPI00124DD76B|nr:DNA cytosine methyltransferase [Brucella anthropi]KAB2779451.1 C-5 cytosine-specific DNA methylase [Brucella anthropi]